MTIDYKEVQKYFYDVEKVETDLQKYGELFDDDNLYEFKRITSNLKNDVGKIYQNTQKLRIGIVGAVKAGKSSFLNACFFEGKEYLPKAATPMTAVLIEITYSDQPQAKIHYYTHDDWNDIKRQAEKYDKKLEDEYNKYLHRMHNQSIKSKLNPNEVFTKQKSLEEFEKSFKCNSEIQKGAKELMRMVDENTSLLDKLGKDDLVTGDVISKLNDYVGAKGTYTAIVKYVELKVNNPILKSIEIVDTPGLNDPVVSRSIKTKQFLRSCDVVLLLSSCSQFMDSNTVSLMANSLPSAGVSEILVIGSKLDSGILNEDCKDFKQAWKKSLNSYKDTFRRNLESAKKEGRYLDILNKLEPQKVLFVSSVCSVIDMKRNEHIPLNKEEEVVLKNLREYDNFDENILYLLGGIERVQEELNNVLERKKEIIEGRNNNILSNAKNSHLRILDKIIQETTSRKKLLNTVSAEELNQRSKNIKETINLSRNRIGTIFEKAKIRCDERIESIKPEISNLAQNYQNISVKVSHKEIQRKENIGFLGLKTEIIRYDETEETANISEVINNIRRYSTKCQEYVNEEFKNIFNKDEISQKIKEVMLTAFDSSNINYDENEILMPLEIELNKLSIPHIDNDYSKYIDELNTSFRGNIVKNNEIHKLNYEQTLLLIKIEADYVNQLKEKLDEISSILDYQSATFADKIENKFCNELDKLNQQSKEKERYLNEYENAEKVLKEMKRRLS